jgi:GT2 family glycosyltransferase
MELLDLGAVLLNWNGRADTIECLTSIYAQREVPAYVVLVDNGSTDSSVESVVEWMRAHPRLRSVVRRDNARQDCRLREFLLRESPEGEAGPGAAIAPRLVLIENRTNLGFAAGCNVGIRLLMDRGVRYVLLLNNDTVVGPDALAHLVRGMDQSPARQCMVPQIRYLGAPSRIWNCGGVWTWLGVPRYLYAEQSVAALDGHEPFDVTFVTGCALIIRAAWLQAHGILSERFFFGEEDVELSWRMRLSGTGSMGCWPSSVIYHKVSASITRMAEVGPLPRIYCDHLSRMIFLRTVWGGGLRWQARRAAVLTFLAWRLVSRYGATFRDSLTFVSDLARDSSEKNAVSADFFFWLMKEKFQRGRRAS